MVRIFRHYVPGSLLFIGILEHLLMVVAVYSALFLRWADPHDIAGSLNQHLPVAVTFATTFLLMMFALGLYDKNHIRDIGTVATRLMFSFAFGFIALALLYYVFPTLAIWRSSFVIAVLFSFIGILAFRWLYLQVADIDGLKRRILVLGAGSRAARIERLERDQPSASFTCVGFVPLGDRTPEIDPDQNIWGNVGLAGLAHEQNVEELVVALDDRRGSLPVRSLLDCKLAGLDITDYPTFWERETGKVDLDALHPSWLIFSDGFVGGWLQSIVKRLFDLGASLILLVATLPLLLFTALCVKLDSRGPVFYRQERVGLNGHGFMLLKFRSMRNDAEKDGVPRWAAQNDSRVTHIGRFIRLTRIDEIPQIINVFKGQMSFIGPRPERPFFVDRLKDLIPYYLERHRVKPGISGWAQLNYPYGASDEDAKEKFQYDLYYIKNYSLFLDLIVLVQTARVVLWPSGAGAR